MFEFDVVRQEGFGLRSHSKHIAVRHMAELAFCRIETVVVPLRCQMVANADCEHPVRPPLEPNQSAQPNHRHVAARRIVFLPNGPFIPSGLAPNLGVIEGCDVRRRLGTADGRSVAGHLSLR